MYPTVKPTKIQFIAFRARHETFRQGHTQITGELLTSSALRTVVRVPSDAVRVDRRPAMSRRTTKVRVVTNSSSSKSATRSRKRGKKVKETRSSDTGDKPSSNNDESPSQKQPSPTAVQSTLPSSTPVYQDEGSLQPCTTQHGTTEIEDVPQVKTDYTQNDQTERSERTPLVPVTAQGHSDTTDGSPIPKNAVDRSQSNRSRSGKRKKSRRKGTISTRAFFPPHLIGTHMSQRRVRRVRNSVEEDGVLQFAEIRAKYPGPKNREVPNLSQNKRTPTSDASASAKPDKSGGKQGRDSSRERSGSKSKKSKRSKSKRRRRKHANQAERDARFYQRVEKFKNKKVEMDCSCPINRCECGEKILRRVGGCMQTAGRACWVVCLPPLPSLILNKQKIGESIKKIVIRKADKSSLNKSWLFGFEHRCYKRLDPKRVECFVIETRKNHYIACVMIRTPTAQPRYTILYSHPNGSDLSDHMNGIPSVVEIAKFLDCDIVIFDYSGYGISSTAAAIALVAETQAPVAGVILLAPIASMLRVLLWKRLCFDQPFARRKPCVDKFRSIEKIPLVNVPVLVCHGKDDIVVPIMHGEAIYANAPNKVPPLWIPDASHNNLENTKELWARVRHFLYNDLAPTGTPIASSQPATPLGPSSPVKPPTVIHL
ncbi:hypothetical protein PRIPAC_82443 [Pristionchus pacificus]|uniref:Hydrolase n=1 Tax=Pristionchus pacificus TaxID=54126 RepID=A0A2A6CBM5_PRIPA|nr:hypothetical protein PRIPAC_82443 [Pristionchus pacificus]|eukprot:PDM75625.1 hydrolase [Pristionchus pacificus]